MNWAYSDLLSSALRCDIMIMNLRFTGSTGHKAKKVGVRRRMFAAFGSTEGEQRLMSQATGKLTFGPGVNRI